VKRNTRTTLLLVGIVLAIFYMQREGHMRPA
jgi:hypothetical protein